MDLQYKDQAFYHAEEFESIYNYSDHYKVRNNPTVWKYMNLEKFESLLKNKAHFFAKPNAFIDPLEGSYSFWDIQQYPGIELPLVSTRDYMKKIQEFSAISCWHMNDYESAGMWDLYLSGKDGVAIKTDYESLINSITDLRYKIFSAKLQYVDFHHEMTSKNIYDTLFYKRKSFSHESELRLMIIPSRIDVDLLENIFLNKPLSISKWDGEIDKLEEQSYNFSHGKGNLVSCDLQTLIKAIYVSPNSSEGVVDKVKEIAIQYGISLNKVIQSDLYKDFIY
ncbi:DUF2971 domain-containing protein [Psychrobacillus sp. NPDC058041]|uniref:DUF2971 domain-containing protein n=1 Tax=Psychrobacillus sp. NPDC058041 TaxID=3346310 RepID=UPI0036DDA493